jgi:hypothetical protein
MLDPLTAASVTVAWVIAFNKPFYPLYVWYLAGDGVLISCLTVVAAPLFAALALTARRTPFLTRLGVPLIGIVDTVMAGKVLGQATGTELFLAPCMLLVALSFRPEEKWWQRGKAALCFLAFVLFHGRMGEPLAAFTPAAVQSLFTLNAFSVASLMVFVTFRNAGLPRS